MGEIVQFVKSLILLAIILGVMGSLAEATGIVGKAAVQAHQHGGISFKWMNLQLLRK